MILAAQYYRPPFPERRYWKEDLDGMKAAGLNAVQLWVLWAGSSRSRALRLRAITTSWSRKPASAGWASCSARSPSFTPTGSTA